MNQRHLLGILLIAFSLSGCDLLDIPIPGINDNEEETTSKYEEWGNTFHGTDSCDEFYAVTMCADSNFIAVGYTGLTLAGENAVGLVTKFDIEGEEIWRKDFPDSIIALYMNDVLPVGNDQYLVLGTREGTIYNPNWNYVRQIYMCMLDSEGQLLWESLTPEEETWTVEEAALLDNQTFAIAGQDENGYFRVAEFSISSGELLWSRGMDYCTGDYNWMTPGGITRANDGNILAVEQIGDGTEQDDIVVVKLETGTGNLIWDYRYESSQLTGAGAIIQREDGTIVVSGYVDVGPENDLLLLSLDSDGEFITAQNHCLGTYANGRALHEKDTTLYMGGFGYYSGLYGVVAKVWEDMGFDDVHLDSYEFGDYWTLINDFVFDDRGGMVLVGTTHSYGNVNEIQGDLWITRINFWEDETE